MLCCTASGYSVRKGESCESAGLEPGSAAAAASAILSKLRSNGGSGREGGIQSRPSGSEPFGAMNRQLFTFAIVSTVDTTTVTTTIDLPATDKSNG